MKFADVKERIDKFFKEKSSEEIYKLALSYGFEQVEVDDEEEELKRGSFDNNEVIVYVSKKTTYKFDESLSYSEIA
jgi:hypothetical protein